MDCCIHISSLTHPTPFVAYQQTNNPPNLHFSFSSLHSRPVSLQPIHPPLMAYPLPNNAHALSFHMTRHAHASQLPLSPPFTYLFFRLVHPTYLHRIFHLSCIILNSHLNLHFFFCIILQPSIHLHASSSFFLIFQLHLHINSHFLAIPPQGSAAYTYYVFDMVFCFLFVLVLCRLRSNRIQRSLS